MTTIDIETLNSEDIIDVRDIIERVEELESEIEDACEAKDVEAIEAYQPELDTLRAILEDLKGYGGDEQWRGDWYPVTLIRDSYFNDYMDEMLEDCGELPKNLPCYLSITVDYKALQMDYTSIEIDGVTYWYR